MKTERCRPAFTLPEVLVSIVLFAVGMLGLAGSATAIATQVGEAQQVRDGTLLAGAVLDSLRGTACQAVVGGTRTSGSATVRWSASAARSTVQVSLSLGLPARRGPRSWIFEALLPCER